jgi:hypothetical protein
MLDPELESLKTSIDMRAYAASQGYLLDHKASWRGSAVMRHANGDKVIIKRDTDDHYVYFSVRDDADHGSIIDFVQRRLGLNLGAVRKELRPWIGKFAEALPYPPLAPAAKDRTLVETQYAETQDAFNHPFLENERAIPAVLLPSERFAGRVRVDARGNAIFPHFDRGGLCGFEIKNRNFTGFASGGSKGLWLSNEEPDDNCLVFCESAVDALSYAALFAEDGTRYASLGGNLSPQQCELIRSAVANMPRNAKIIAAMDADAAGEKLAENIHETMALTGRDDVAYQLHQPDGFKDWNDQLRKRPLQYVLRRPREPVMV